MNPKVLLDFGLRLLVMGVAVLALSFLIAPHYVGLWLPLYKQVAGWLLADYRIVELVLRSQPPDQLVSLTIETARPLIVGTKLLPAGMSLSSTTLQGHAMQHLVIVVSLLLAWPQNQPGSQRLVLLLFALPALFILEALDIPFVLAGAIQDLVLAQFSPSEWAQSWLVRWMNFLNGGGRLGLSLAVALIAIGCCRCIFAGKVDQSKLNVKSSSVGL